MSMELVMHSAFGLDEVLSAVLAAAGRCLGPRTEARVRHWAAQPIARWLAAEDAAQCTCVSLHDFKHMCSSPVLWDHVKTADSQPMLGSCTIPHAWAQVRPSGPSCLAPQPAPP